MDEEKFIKGVQPREEREVGVSHMLLAHVC